MESGKKALLIVDVQNDFISGSLALAKCPANQDGLEVVPIINSLLDAACFDAVIYTQDWHPPGHISFIDNVSKFQLVRPTSAEEVKCFDTVTFNIESNPIRQTLWPVHCIQNTWGSEFNEKLKIIPEGLFVRKGIDEKVDSYSAFWNNSHSHCSELHTLLTQLQITDVYVAGLAYDYCVGYTALDARKFGYKTVVIEDACRGVDVTSMTDMREKLGAAGATFCHYAEIDLDGVSIPNY